MFNGEVYNHRTLRPELEAAGHRFRTSSDTETIVHAWEQYGPACVDRLEGMFALAILDERRRELFIARDRLGKKPLYYAVLDGVLHFASELPALAASPSWKGELDLSGLEGLPVARVLARAKHAVCRRLQAASRPHAARQGRPRHDETLLGRHAVRLRPARRERAARRRRRDARHGRHGSPRKRSAAWRVSVWRHRLGLDRVLHGRGARGSSRHDDGRVCRSRAQRTGRRPSDGGTRQGRASRTSHRAVARRGARPCDHRLRRADGRLIGDPDVVRVARGAVARHRRAQRRRRRRDVCGLRLPVCAARARIARAAADARRRRATAGPVDRSRVAAWPARAQGPARGHAARQPVP